MADPPEERPEQPTPNEVGQPAPPPGTEAVPPPAAEPSPPPPAPPGALATDPVAPPPPAAEPKQWKWIPTILVFVVIAAVTLGGYIVVGALEPLDEQESVTIGPMTVHPPDGWEVGEDLTIGQAVPGKRLANGTGYADIFAGGFSGDSAALYAEYMRILSESAEAEREADQFRYTLEPSPITGPGGLEGVRGFYIGTFAGLSAPIEGEVFAFVGAQGEGLVFDGWASEGQYLSIQQDVVEMVTTAELGGGTGEGG